jgi:hypothetical protein
MLAEGSLTRNALAWREGLPEWIPILSVVPPPVSAPRPGPRPNDSLKMASPGAPGRIWMVHDAGKQFGPHTGMELASLVGAGSISASAVAWCESSPQWVPIGSIVPITNLATIRPLRSIASIKVPILVSAIANIVVGLVWLSTGCGVVVTVPLVVLSVFEFMLWAKADEMAGREFAAKAHRLGVIEIVAGLFNTATLVCGILVVVNASKLKNLR